MVDAGRRHGPVPPSLLVPNGDDAAVWRPPAGAAVVVSQDALVEGEDFRRAWIGPHALGRRALEVCLSDLAAMGARPHLCLATLCAPGETAVDDVMALHAGLVDAAARRGCALVGGDVSRTAGPLVLDLCVLGSVAPDRVLRRDAGTPGDVLAVTGVLGRAAAGLHALTGQPVDGIVPDDDRRHWEDAQLRPRARLDEGLHVAGGGVRCGGDLSDGLLVDAGRTARACGCAAELWLDAIPVDRALTTVFGDRWPALALGGGEDFELLLAAPAETMRRLQAGWPPALAPLTVVGRLVEGEGVHLLDRAGGGALPLPAVASRHFS